MFKLFSLLLSVHASPKQVGLGVCMMAASSLMIVAVPAWAFPSTINSISRENTSLNDDKTKVICAIDPYLSSPDTSRLAQDKFAEVIRAIQAYPEVVVFPIQVAGPVTATAAKNLANKIAQASMVGGIAVIYPDIGEPYRSIFAQIINGIEEKAKGRVANFAVGSNVDVGELNDSLRRQDTRVVIALGRQGVEVATALEGNYGVVVGGVLMAPKDEERNLQVNSLSPDPALLFSRLKGMKSKVRRIFTVYDPRRNEWMMKLARNAAFSQGLELVAYKAQDLRSAMRAYQKIFAEVDGSKDALWLPQDSTTVEESTVLPMVLKESWENNLAVFSSSFGNVRRGVLFSLYPDNVGLGRHLAGSALGMIAAGGSEASSMLPLREVLMAINLRTAKHLGLNIDHPQNFDIAFPEQ
jgi:putative ABC transport system substrate-binding protein